MSEQQFFIETGYLELHLWVTYKCAVGCPHCYLKSMDVKSPDLSLDKYRILLKQVQDYRKNWNKLRIVIYGAEPQTLSAEYYHDLMSMTEMYFDNAEFSMYTSLQKLDDNWLSVFRRIKEHNGLDMTAISYDGLMRGEKYNERLFKNLKILNDNGMRVGMMSVLNKSMLELGAKAYVDVLEQYKFPSFSIKPFLPIKGQYSKWLEFATTMDEYSDFVIDVHKELKSRNLDKISGMITDVAHSDSIMQSLGGWVIFVDGGLRFLYMAYDNREEFLQEFGKIDENHTFTDIINGDKRKQFLQDQRCANFRTDCLICEYAGRCLAEVYKDNYDMSSECVGAKKFIDWINKEYGVVHDTKV